MKTAIRCVFAAAVGLVAAAGFALGADITGKVTLKGTPPREKALDMDPSCGQLHRGKRPTTRFYVVGKDGGLADVFVQITAGLPKQDYPVPTQSVEIDQKGCEFIPYVLGARTKQRIVVKNSDPVLHSVHPTPTVSGNKEYDLGQLPGAPDLAFSWENPEVFLRFKCDVHPWMFTYVGLVDHPFWCVSDTNGNFSIKDVPQGTYTVEAYHRKAGKSTQEVKVEAGNKQVDFTLEVPQK